MRSSLRLVVLVSVILIANLFAGAFFSAAATSTAAVNSLTKDVAADIARPSFPTSNEQVTMQEVPRGIVNGGPPPLQPTEVDVQISGVSGSGWRPDVLVAGSTDNEENPSMSSFINATNNAVTMYIAMQKWDSVGGRWWLNIQRSDNRGSTWYYWFGGYWEVPANRSMMNPSIAVSPYNGTVFVAVQSGAYHVDPWDLSNDLGIWRINPSNTGDWQFYNVDADVDEDRNPQLVSEYAFGSGNFLFLVYENYTTTNDRDLRVARSTDWGMTWWTQDLRGAGAESATYTQPSIAYVQGNVYIAYRHSSTYLDNGHIDVSYSTDYGGSYLLAADVGQLLDDASWPSVAGSHIGPWHGPATVIVAYEYNTSLSNHDILYAWSTDNGTSWVGGNGALNRIAASADHEFMPRLSVDGMGTENWNVGGNFHAIYRIGSRLYYTQLQYWDVPLMFGPTPWAYYLGWSTPHGNITDNNALCSYSFPIPAITTFTKNVGGVLLWEPGVAWTDLRSNTNYDIYYTTPGTDFSITVTPSSQSVVAGKSLSYYFAVNLLSGPTAPAYLSGTNWPWIILGTNYAVAEYSVSPINPTATSKLTVHTSNLMGLGTWSFNATATIGGYRRIVSIPFTVVAPPKLTLNLSPTTVPRGQTLTLSGQLTAGTTTPQKIYIYYRLPHLTGTWKLATTLNTNAAGAFSVGAPVPFSLPVGMYDLAAFWVDTTTGSYAVSPITVFTVT